MSATIVVGHINDEELKQSISNLVAHVKRGTKTMTDDFNAAIANMQNKLKELGGTKVNFENINTSKLNVKEQKNASKSNKDMVQTSREATDNFDALASAIKNVTQQQANLTERIQAQSKYGELFVAPLIAQYKQLEETLKSLQSKLPAAHLALVSASQGTLDARRWGAGFGKTNPQLQLLRQQYTEEEKLAQQSAIAEAKRTATLEKEAQKRKELRAKEEEQNAKLAQKYQDGVLKNAMRSALNTPATSLDQIQAKIQEITRLTSTTRPLGIFSDAELKRQDSMLDTLRQKAQALIQEQRKQQEVVATPRTAQESAQGFLFGYREKARALAEEIKRIENLSLQQGVAQIEKLAQQADVARARIAQLEAKMKELRSTPTNSRMETLARTQQIEAASKEIESLKQKIRELDAEAKKITPDIAQAERLAQMRAEYEGMRQTMRDIAQSFVDMESQQKAIARDAQRYTEEIRRQAQAIRESKDFQEKGYAIISRHQGLDAVVYDSKVPLEEQLLQIQQREKEELAAQNRERQQAQQLQAQQAQQAQAQLGVEGAITQEVKKRRKYVSPTTTMGGEFNVELSALREFIGKKLFIDPSTVLRINESTASLNALQESMRQVRSAYERLTNFERNSPFGKALIAQYQILERESRRASQALSRPINLDSALSMPARTIDEISEKIRQLNAYKRGLNLTDPKQAGEIKQVDAEINRLNADLNKYMSTTQRAQGSNNALTRSWNNMKNRLAFYFTVGASTQFVKNLIEVRSQYEMNERALGILIGSAEYGTKVFNELSSMALVSPYTLIELSNAAKQLTAYDVAAKDVVDTTRRLADMAAAVGIPMERLTYALGQIKAYGYLNSRDARMFLNAGIPLTQELAKHYTELEGRLVSVGDVYDKIKKKAVGFNDVMEVITKMTDEGGKFFDFQAKMADTLKVRLANLTLAWNNMLNDIGRSEQGALVGLIGALREIFLRWKDIYATMRNVAIAFGIVKLGQIVYVMWQEKVGVATAAADVMSQKFLASMYAMKRAFMSLVNSPLTWFTLLASAAISAWAAIVDNEEKIEDFNKAIRNGAEETKKNIQDYLKSADVIRSRLYDRNVATGSEAKSATTTDINEDEANKAWDAMREQIELSTRASGEYLQRLESIENVSERLRQGFKLLDDISAVNSALSQVGDNTFQLSQGLNGWWNLWLLPKGATEELKDYSDAVEGVTHQWSEFGKELTRSAAMPFVGSIANIIMDMTSSASNSLAKFREDLKETTDSIERFLKRNNFTSDINKINETYAQVANKIIQEGQLNPQQAFVLQLELEESRSKAAKEALEIRIADEKKALAAARDEESAVSIKANLATLEQELKDFDKFNGRSRVIWSDFTKFMSERHSAEIREMFRGMNEEQIKSFVTQDANFDKWVKKMAQEYAATHKMSYDEAFNYLKNWVKDANQWQIFLKLNITTGDEKSFYDEISGFDSELDTVLKRLERNRQAIKDMNTRGVTALGTSKDSDKYRRALKQIEDDEKRAAELRANYARSAKEDREAAKRARKAAAAARRAEREAESELQKALKETLSLIDKVRSTYKTLTKEGVNSTRALEESTSGYGETLKSINTVFAKWGLEKLDLSKYAGVANPRAVMDMLQNLLDGITKTGKAKPAEIKNLQVKLKDLKVDSITFDQKTITDTLNSELAKIDEEYELALAFDADPDLAHTFADMFGMPSDFVDALPRDLMSKYQKIQDAITKALNEGYNATGEDVFNLFYIDDLYEWAKRIGLAVDSSLFKSIENAYKNFRKETREALKETEKYLDEYIQKYGVLADKIGEIEAKRLDDLKNLEKAYPANRQTSPDFVAKRDAINKKAQKEMDSALFEDFKNSDLYIAMFQRIGDASTIMLEAMRDRLNAVRNSLKDLTPEQLKFFAEKMEAIELELVSRNPFKNLAKNAQAYFQAFSKSSRRQLREQLDNATKNYDAQQFILASLEKEYEARKRTHPEDAKVIKDLEDRIKKQREAVELADEERKKAEELANKYNLLKKIIKEQAQAIAKAAQVAAANLQSLSELRDFLQNDLGIELSSELNGLVDGLSKVGEGINKVVSSVQSADVVGAVLGIGQVFYGLFDGIASLFGGGSAQTKKLEEDIEKSEKRVKKLELAYVDLEHAINKAYGTATVGAQKAAIANKKLQLAELQRQLALEQSKRSKDQDEDKIIELQKQIKELQYDIQDATDDIVNNLLGISSVGDAVENMVSGVIDALRSGEDAIGAFNESIDDMIINLIKKFVATKMLAPIFEAAWNAVQERIMARKTGEEYARLAKREAALRPYADVYKETDAMSSYYQEWLETKKKLAEYDAVTKDDLRYYIDVLNSLKGEGQGLVDYTAELLKEFGLDKTGDKELSALQQGIQSITEETAGAIEAYLNGISQQIYLHSDLLVQIRDAVVALDSDVQTSTQAQMLLQLQQSYQVQMSIQGILEGWNSPNGMAVRVEMV